jgi:ABC-type amino acid transport substrate-binding protein
MPAGRVLSIVLLALIGLLAAGRSAGASQDGGAERAAAPERLVVGVFEAPPFSEPVRAADGTTVWTGTSIQLFESVADSLGFEVEYRAGLEDDVLEALALGSIDVCASPLAPTPARLRLFDLSHPFATVGLTAALRAEDAMLDELGLLADGLVKASQRRIYLILGLAIVAAAALLWFLERSRNQDFGSRRIDGFGSALWWAVVTLSTVGYGDKVPRTPPGRFVAGVWMLASLVLTSIFTATIVSSLTIGSLQTVRVESPADLARLRVVAVRSSIAAYWLEGIGIDFTGATSLEAALDRLARGECDAVVGPAIELRSAARACEGIVVGKARFTEEYMCFGLARGRGDDFARKVDEAIITRAMPSAGMAELEPVRVAPLPADRRSEGEPSRGDRSSEANSREETSRDETSRGDSSRERPPATTAAPPPSGG